MANEQGKLDFPLGPARERVHVELLLLLCVVEHANVAAAQSARERNPAVVSMLERVRSQLRRTKQVWARSAVLDGLLAVLQTLQREATGRSQELLAPAALAALCERQCNWLIGFEQRRSANRSRARRRPVPSAMRVNRHWRDLASDDVQRVSLNMAEECYDALAVAREYLRTELQTSGEMLDHDLQLFIRRVFQLRYRKHYVPLATLCTRVNALFFNEASFSFRAPNDVRPPTVSAELLLETLREALETQLDPDKKASQEELARLALGFYLALRFGELLRLQLEVPDAQEASVDPSAVHRVGVRLLQPLAYSIFRARIFGTLSGIDGWNEILGGGLLPGLELGRTWVVSGEAGSGKTSLAIHLGADMAARDHLVVYFSFEEPYLNITDRVLSFRLYQPDRFQILSVDDENIEACLARATAEQPHLGMLLYYGGSSHNLSDTLRKLRAAIAAHAPRFQRATAVIIDSVDALEPAAPAPPGDSRYERRHLLRTLIQQLEQQQFSAMLLTEAGNPELPTLQHLADTYVEVGNDDEHAQRWLQFHKSRLADFTRGRHGYRLRDGRGVALVPNLWSVQRIVRRKIPAPMSDSSVIAFPEGVRDALPVPVLQDKSSLLVWGNERSAILSFWLHLLTEPTSQVRLGASHLLNNPGQLRTELPRLDKEPLGSVLVVSFRTSQPRLQQSLRKRPALLRRWDLLPGPSITWYQPQPGLTGARIVHNLRRVLADSRIQGRPIERIVFDEIDAIDSLLPSLEREPELWPTIFGLLATEPVSVIYVVGTNMASTDKAEPRFTQLFAGAMDYCCHIWSQRSSALSQKAATESRDVRRYISLYKHPVPLPSGPASRVAIQVEASGNLVVAQGKLSHSNEP